MGDSQRRTAAESSVAGVRLRAVLDHADHEIVVHVALERIGDEIRPQQIQVIEMRHAPDFGAFG
jgi:hypothetical protein